MLIEQGYESLNGEAYDSVMFQNANLSVRVTDDFMQAVETEQAVDHPLGHQPEQARPDLPGPRRCSTTWPNATWRCGDPGVQYDTTINRWHTCPNSGRINASNPCVTGDTLVATAEGYRRIGELGRPDGRNHRRRRPQSRGSIASSRPAASRSIELKTRSGYRVRLTADHPVCTVNRGDVPAAELTVDDVLQLEQPGFGNEFVPDGVWRVARRGRGRRLHHAGPTTRISCLSRSASRKSEVAHRLQAMHRRDASNGLNSKTTIAAGRRTLRETPPAARRHQRRPSSRRSCASYAVLDAGSTDKQLHRPRFRARSAQPGGDSPRAVHHRRHRGQLRREIAVRRPWTARASDLLRQVQLLLLGFGIKAKIYENRRALGQDTAILPDGKGGVKSYPVAANAFAADLAPLPGAVRAGNRLPARKPQGRTTGGAEPRGRHVSRAADRSRCIAYALRRQRTSSI